MAEGKKRFWELDLVRGICVLMMVVDHLFYSLYAVFPSFLARFGVDFWGGAVDLASAYWNHPLRPPLHLLFITLFFLICGISCTLTKSNLRRGIITVLAATLITVVTSLIDKYFVDGATISFGVVHMLGSAMLLYWFFQLPSKALSSPLIKLSFSKKRLAELLQRLLQLLPAIVGITMLCLYFGLKWGEYQDFYLYSNVDFSGTQNQQETLSMLLELKNFSMPSSDYFPILPYAMLVLSGGLIGTLLYAPRKKTPIKVRCPRIFKPFCFVGRHALIIYLTHQVLIVGFLFLATFLVSRF